MYGSFPSVREGEVDVDVVGSGTDNGVYDAMGEIAKLGGGGHRGT